MTTPADAGRPMLADLVAEPRVKYFKFATATRQISLRNTGTHILWISFTKKTWVDVAAGTSLDDKIICNGLWFCTQTGSTSFLVNGIALNQLTDTLPSPTDDELR